MAADAIECPLCLDEGKLKRTEVLDRLGVKARIAVGIPVDSDIEYTVEVTMLKAMEGQREMQRLPPLR